MNINTEVIRFIVVELRRELEFTISSERPLKQAISFCKRLSDRLQTHKLQANPKGDEPGL